MPTVSKQERLKKRRAKRKKYRLLRMRMVRRIFILFFLAAAASTVLGLDWPLLGTFTLNDSLPAFFDFGEVIYDTAEVYTPIPESAARQTSEAGRFRVEADVPEAVALVATPTPTPTSQRTQTETPRATATIRVIVVTVTPSGTLTQGATAPPTLTQRPTGVAASTSNAAVTLTSNAAATLTSNAAATSAVNLTSIATALVTPTATHTPFATVIAEISPTATGRPTDNATSVPTNTSTPRPTNTATSQIKNTPTPFPTGTPTQFPSPTGTATASPTTTSTSTMTVTPTATPTLIPTAVIVPTTPPVVPTAVPTAVPTPIPTATPNTTPVTLAVTGLTDTSVPGDGVCAINEALANSINNVDSSGGDCPAGGAGTDTITLPAGTIGLNSTLSGTCTCRVGTRMGAATEIIIFQGNNTTLSMLGTSPVLELNGPLVVVLDSVTLLGGAGTDVGGGLLVNEAAVTLRNSIVNENIVTSANGAGGGIAVVNNGSLVLDSVEVSNNIAVLGGGVYVESGSQLSVVNSTFSNNEADDGGGVYVDGGSAELSYTTIAENTANNVAGGVYNSGGTLTLKSSLLAQNIAPVSADCLGTFISGNYNLISTGSGCTPVTAGVNDLIDVAAGLNSFDDNGGNTWTHSFNITSPAYNAIVSGENDCGVLTADQIGTARPQNGNCDIGAFELVYSQPSNLLTVDTVDNDGSSAFQVCDDSVANDCSLRGAISKANADAGNAYTVTLPANTYSFSSPLAASGEDANLTGDLDIIGKVTIVGADSATTIIDAVDFDRVFQLHNASSSLTLQDVTIQGGNVSTALPVNCDAALLGCGGGILVSQGILTINETVVVDNQADDGGGIANMGGVVYINESTIRSNNALIGTGGLLTSGTTRILKSTFSSNMGLSAIHASSSSSDLTIENSTISGNQGGVLNQSSSTVTIVFSTIYENVDYGLNSDATSVLTISSSIVGFNGSADCAGDVHLLQSGGYNIASDATCSFAFTGDLNSIDPLLDGLANNGGATQTHALQLASPAREQTPNTINGCGLTYVTDQRGISRPNGLDCDSGAYEG